MNISEVKEARKKLDEYIAKMKEAQDLALADEIKLSDIKDIIKEESEKLEKDAQLRIAKQAFEEAKRINDSDPKSAKELIAEAKGLLKEAPTHEEEKNALLEEIEHLFGKTDEELKEEEEAKKKAEEEKKKNEADAEKIAELAKIKIVVDNAKDHLETKNLKEAIENGRLALVKIGEVEETAEIRSLKTAMTTLLITATTRLIEEWHPIILTLDEAEQKKKIAMLKKQVENNIKNNELETTKALTRIKDIEDAIEASKPKTESEEEKKAREEAEQKTELAKIKAEAKRYLERSKELYDSGNMVEASNYAHGGLGILKDRELDEDARFIKINLEQALRASDRVQVEKWIENIRNTEDKKELEEKVDRIKKWIEGGGFLPLEKDELLSKLKKAAEREEEEKQETEAGEKEDDDEKKGSEKEIPEDIKDFLDDNVFTSKDKIDEALDLVTNKGKDKESLDKQGHKLKKNIAGTVKKVKAMIKAASGDENKVEDIKRSVIDLLSETNDRIYDLMKDINTDDRLPILSGSIPVEGNENQRKAYFLNKLDNVIDRLKEEINKIK